MMGPSIVQKSNSGVLYITFTIAYGPHPSLAPAHMSCPRRENFSILYKPLFPYTILSVLQNHCSSPALTTSIANRPLNHDPKPVSANEMDKVPPELPSSPSTKQPSPASTAPIKLLSIPWFPQTTPSRTSPKAVTVRTYIYTYIYLSVYESDTHATISRNLHRLFSIDDLSIINSYSFKRFVNSAPVIV